MAKIAFLLLCHHDPSAVIRQVRALVGAGDHVAIHLDARAPDAAFTAINDAFEGDPDVALVRPRIRCGWGEWSLVQATLSAIDTALAAFPEATHLYLISGDCRPVKSAAHVHAVLDARDIDLIESFDFFTSGWIRTGMKEDRLIYRHLVNERRHKRLFYALLAAQRRLGLRRAIPGGIDPMIGSQWWCLRRATVTAIRDLCRERPDILRFFRTTWIADETFFQTLVRHVVSAAQIADRAPTFLAFTDYGMPATFHDDHFDFLLGQDAFFARKIAPEARRLRAELDTLWRSDRRDFPAAGDGRALFAYLTQRGRIGHRFAARFWEQAGDLGHDRTLIVLMCKKYHLAKRLAQALRDRNVLPAIDYLFEEADTVLPDLGGLERGGNKRHHHRRAFLRLLFDALRTDRLAICLDPANLHILHDLRAGGADVRMLLIECDHDPAFLHGHAERVGLIGPGTSNAERVDLLAAIARDFDAQIATLRSASLPGLHVLRRDATVADRAETLARLLDLDSETVRPLVAEVGVE